MIHAIIIEDEKAAQESLVQALCHAGVEVTVKTVLSSVQESIQYLTDGERADIIFSDVQLTDGLSFEIFNETGITIPVVFITGYDEFMMNAFEHNGIDYLLKPVTGPDITKALLKYQMLEKHFAGSQKGLEKLMQSFQSKKRSRLLVRKGLENISLRLEDIALFYTENKIVFVIDRWGKKYLCDKNLTDLEIELDKNTFFRANRQYIVNINYVKGYKTYEKVKLQVDLTLPELKYCIIISQETAPAFRKWIYEA